MARFFGFGEPFQIQALVAQLAIEGPYVSVFNRVFSCSLALEIKCLLRSSSDYIIKRRAVLEFGRFSCKLIVMSSTKSPNPPINHHYLPRFYLKGFASSTDPSRTWVYERQSELKTTPHKRNPQHTAIKRAAMQEGFYSCTRENAPVDHQSYEEALSKRESADARLLDKIRTGGVPNEAQKSAMAKFILLMHRRVPAHRNRFPALWRDIVSELRAKSPLLDGLRFLQNTTPKEDVEKHAKISQRLQEYDDLLVQKMQQAPPDDLRLDSIINDRPLPAELLAEMNWHVFKAPPGTAFIASDDPVFLRGGLQHAKSEVVFPLSSQMALVAGWTEAQSFQWEKANRATVEKINAAMMPLAVRNIFFDQNSPALANTFNQTSHVPWSEDS